MAGIKACIDQNVSKGMGVEGAIQKCQAIAKQPTLVFQDGYNVQVIQYPMVTLGFFQILTLIFIIFKIMGKIDWSWKWVLAPLWIPILISLAIMTVFLVIMLLASRR